MSKSRGNVVNPDEIVEKYGSDCLRMFELFIGPPDIMCEWKDDGIVGVSKFLRRFYKIAVNNAGNKNYQEPSELLRARHRFVKTASERINAFQFNTFISACMEFLNYLSNFDRCSAETISAMCVMLSPMAPHVCEELWSLLGNNKSIFLSGKWPAFDEALAAVDEVSIPVQINGKLRGTINAPKGSDEESVKKLIAANEFISKNLEGKQIVKFVFVKDKIVNYVVK